MNPSSRTPGSPDSRTPQTHTRQELVQQYVRAAKLKVEARRASLDSGAPVAETSAPQASAGSAFSPPPPEPAHQSSFLEQRSPSPSDHGDVESSSPKSDASQGSTTPPQDVPLILGPPLVTPRASVSGPSPDAAPQSEAPQSRQDRQSLHIMTSSESWDGTPTLPHISSPNLATGGSRSPLSGTLDSDTAATSSPCQRKNPSLGLPPSARRGPSNAYTQASFVTPIPEETDSTRSQRSATSNGNPLNVLSPDLITLSPQLPNIQGLSTPQSPIIQSPVAQSPVIQPRTPVAPTLRATTPVDDAQSDDGSQSTLGTYGESGVTVRQADFGRRQRPSLTTIKSGEGTTFFLQSNTPKLPVVSRALSQRSLAGSISSVRSRGSEPGPAPGFFGSDAVLLEVSRPSSLSEDDSMRPLSMRSGPGDDTPARKPSVSSSAGAEEPVRNLPSVSAMSAGRDGPLSKPNTPKSPLSRGWDPMSDNVPTSRHNSTSRPRYTIPASSMYSGLPKHLDRSNMKPVQVTVQPLSGSSTQSPLASTEGPPVVLYHEPNFLTEPKPLTERASASSLPELIKRALRLASNLERGKNQNKDETDNLANMTPIETDEIERRFAGSISEMLKAFPRTPETGFSQLNRSFGQAPLSRWEESRPSHQRSGSGQPLTRNRAARPQRRLGRRCCGMPLWRFILMVLTIILLVAIAIIVPVALIALPEQHSNTTSNTGSSTLATCQERLPCSNGGINISTPNGSCRCICVGGFSGTSCTGIDNECANENIGNIAKASIGSGLPRLLSIAGPEYSIFLNGSTILHFFTWAHLSCSTENSLITFNGAFNRARHLSSDSATDHRLLRHLSISSSIKASSLTPTSLTTSTSLTAFETLTLASSISGFPTPTQSPWSAPPTFTDSQTLDFARLTVLYVLEHTTSVPAAAEAQADLQNFFTHSWTSDPTALEIGGNYTANLVAKQILANGTVVAGKASL